jgi:hypothetical protein
MNVWQAGAILTVPALALVFAVASDENGDDVSAGGTVVTAGIDLDTSNNEAASLGTIETCVQASPGSTHTFDTWVNGIPDDRTLVGFSYNLLFAGGAIASRSHEQLLGVVAGSTVLDVSEAVPDDVSPHSVGALENGGYPPAGEAEGVLGRYSLAIDANASGYLPLSFDLFALSDGEAQEIPAVTHDATIAVAPATCLNDPSDCVTWTATPTVSPSPDPTPPWMPRSDRLICNDTGQAASDLHVLFAAASPGTVALADAPGCPDALVAYESGVPPGYAAINFDWGTSCVDPGEWVNVGFVLECTTPEPGCVKPTLVCAYWTLAGQPVTPSSPAPAGAAVCPSPSPINTLTPTPSPTPSPTLPCPAGPDPSGGCLPCPTWSGAIVLSTCPPIVTPTPTATPIPDIQGDSTCDGAVDASDALAVLRLNAGLTVILPPPCETFDGDVDCSLSTNSVDALKILRHNAALSVTQNEPCPDIGTLE